MQIEENRKLGERNRRIATIISAIAGVPDDRFRYAGYSDEQMIAELARLQPKPELLADNVVDLGRVYGPDRQKEFEVKLEIAVNAIPDGHGYLEIFHRAKGSISDILAKAPHAEKAMSVPFDDDLPSITSVMSHIKVERDADV